jgi:hypothetical protein
MDGMGFLLQSMGIDPEQLKNAAGQVQKTAQAFEKRLISIELKLDLILSHLDIAVSTVEDSVNGRSSLASGGSPTGGRSN